jgi:hypothetical protein
MRAHATGAAAVPTVAAFMMLPKQQAETGRAGRSTARGGAANDGAKLTSRRARPPGLA